MPEMFDGHQSQNHSSNLMICSGSLSYPHRSRCLRSKVRPAVWLGMLRKVRQTLDCRETRKSELQTFKARHSMCGPTKKWDSRTPKNLYVIVLTPQPFISVSSWNATTATTLLDAVMFQYSRTILITIKSG